MSSAKWPNGTTKPKLVPRSGKFRDFSYNIAAIDFGTTYCSLAFLTKDDKERNQPIVAQLNAGRDTESRVPTAILFDRNGKVKSFGYEARSEYKDLEEGEIMDYVYFEQIKMTLQYDETVSREMKLSCNGQDYYLIDVIAQILAYCKERLQAKLMNVSLYESYDVTTFDWVITVPAIWRAKGKQMMREAGYKAGLCGECFQDGRPDPINTPGNLQPAQSCNPRRCFVKAPQKLSLALEPEAAALYCQNMSQEQLLQVQQCDTPIDRHHPPNQYMVVDVGGGTIDIAIHKKAAGRISVLRKPTGSDKAGTTVNRKFMEYLGEIVDDKGFTKFIKEAHTPAATALVQASIVRINHEFEGEKQKFGEHLETKEKYVVELDPEFVTFYKSKLEKCDNVRVRRNRLNITCSQMEKFFSSSAGEIVEIVSSLMEDVDEIDALYLVGGYGGSNYIHRKVQQEIKSLPKVVVPRENDLAVVYGAVLFRSMPEIVQSRKADATYGTTCRATFDSQIHDPYYATHDGKCKHLFVPIVQVNDEISAEKVYSVSYVVGHRCQTIMSLDIYRTDEKFESYIKDKRSNPTVEYLGQVDVEMSDLTGGINREVQWLVDFSQTEIQVYGKDVTTSREFTGIIDFLSHRTG